MSSKISQTDTTSKKNKKKLKKKQSSLQEPSDDSKNAPGSPSSIGSGSKSIVKKLSLGKIYKKKKEIPTPEKEEPKDTSAKTSLEEVLIQDETETASSTTASRDTEDDRSTSPFVVTPTKEQKLLEEEIQDNPPEPLSLEPIKAEQEHTVTTSQETQEENKEVQSKEETSDNLEEKDKEEPVPGPDSKEQIQYQEKLKQLDKTMQQVGPSGGDVKRECLYKILVIGELGAGKTSIIKRYVHQFFSQHYRATIGVDFALKVINWDSNTIIRLQLWDIAGQERFGNMTRVYYKEAVGAFIVFDVTRQATFDAVLKWKNDLDNKVQLPDGGHIPCVLLANKCDQQKEGLVVNSPNKMDEYCKENHFSAWYETSAKENINIEEAAKTLVSQILSNDISDNGKGYGSSKDNGKFPLDSNPDSSSDRRGCSC